MIRRRMHPRGIAEDGPVFDVIFFYLGEPCGRDGPMLRENCIVDSPSTGCFSKEGYDISFGEGSVHGDLVAGVGVKEVLPAELHLCGSSEAITESVGEGVVFSHKDAQTDGVRGVDGFDEGLHDFGGGLLHKSGLIGLCR